MKIRFTICKNNLNKHNARELTFFVSQFVDEEVKRVVWLLDDKLLEEAFEQLVDGVVFQVLLDGLGVVELLKLVHSGGCFLI